MKKIVFLVGIIALFCNIDIKAQPWVVTGNVVAPPDVLGSLNVADVNLISSGIWRARLTQDGNWDVGGNGFVAGTTTASIATGVGNNVDFSNNSGAFGTNNQVLGANEVFVLGRDHNFTVGALDAVIGLGARCQAINSNQSVLAGEDQQLSNGHGCFMGGGHNRSDGPYNVAIGRGLRTTGPMVQAYGDGITNNLANSMIFGINSIAAVITNRGMSIMTAPGGPPAAPAHNLEVDANPALPGTSNIAFFNVPATANNYPALVYDAVTGEIFQKMLGGGVTNACGTLDFVTKDDGTGNLVCSQIYDDGTSVGIGTTGSFAYASLAGARLGSTVPASSGTVVFEANGVIRSLASIVTSDARFKENVRDIPKALDIVKLLNGKTYTWNQTARQTLKADNGLHVGYLAQELQAVIPEVVITDNDGNMGVNYIEIIPILSEAIKEQQKTIEKLQAKIDGMSNKNSGSLDAPSTKGGFLTQNVPNPFSVATEIKYQLPAGTQKAVLGIYDMTGTEVKLYPLSSEISGSVTIGASELKPGMYLYSLITDGNIFDSKKMVLTSN